MTLRSITVLALTLALGTPTLARAQTRGFWLGGLVGLEAGNETGLQLRVDGEVPITRFTPKLQLAGVASASFANLSHDLKVFEIMPAARITYEATRQFGAYGDVGLGLFHAWVDDSSDTGAVMRFLGGGYYQVNPKLRVVGEIGVHPHFGDYDDTTFTLMAGAKFLF